MKVHTGIEYKKQLQKVRMLLDRSKNLDMLFHFDNKLNVFCMCLDLVTANKQQLQG